MTSLVSICSFLCTIIFAKCCRVYMSGHYLSAARSAAFPVDFCLVCFYFIFLQHCVFSVEINCQSMCIEFSSKPLSKYFLELQIHDTPALASSIFCIPFMLESNCGHFYLVAKQQHFFWCIWLSNLNLVRKKRKLILFVYRILC